MQAVADPPRCRKRALDLPFIRDTFYIPLPYDFRERGSAVRFRPFRKDEGFI